VDDSGDGSFVIVGGRRNKEEKLACNTIYNTFSVVDVCDNVAGINVSSSALFSQCLSS
jgi:hypothetical protein